MGSPSKLRHSHTLRKKRSIDAIASPGFTSPARKRVSGSSDLLIDLSGAADEEGQSLLGTILSPVFHLFRGIGKESSSSSSICTTTTTTILAAAADDDGQQLQVKIATSSSSSDLEENVEFNPYLFIKGLPKLSEVVEPCRKFLLPRQTRRCPPVALVLDLDETLVHSTMEHCTDADFSFSLHVNFQNHTVYVRQRPHLQMFMERIVQLFEVIVFTASQSVYAEQLLNILDPKRRVFRHRIFRDSCVLVDGNYLKDLSVLGRDLSKTIIVDNSPQAFGFQVDNGIPIESWFDDQSDCALASLLPFLESLATADDVRPIIAKTYKLRQKIQAAGKPHQQR